MKKTSLLVFFLLFTLFLVGCDNKKNQIGIEELENIKDVNTILREMYQPNREEYGMATIKIDNDIKEIPIRDVIEKNLPKMPDDLWWYRQRLILNKATSLDLLNMTEEYYLQPEIIANQFKDSGINRWRNINVERWTVYGYGTFPADQYTYTYPGEEFYIAAFFYSDFGVETYQGLKLSIVTPDNVIDRQGGKEMVINKSLSQKYIQAEMNQQEILLEPNYPVFQRGWIKRILIKVKVDENTPPGIYGIGFDVGGLDRRKDEEYSSKIGAKYMPFGGFSIGREQLRVGINVQ